MITQDLFFDTDEFELTNTKLGEGTFGKVYIVISLKDNKQYAAKIINSSNMEKAISQFYFMSESQILKKLSHPAIVKFYGINFHSFNSTKTLEPTILTEYLPNKSLKEILDKEKKCIANDDWTPTKKYICLLGISDAIRYLHAQGILHRDIKPENILIDEHFYPHVCDFGFSKCFPSALSNSMMLSMAGDIGTPLYMAPELFDDDTKFSPSIDVYAFSMLAYEIVTGKEPFSENKKPLNAIQLSRKVRAGCRPEFPKCVTQKMKSLIQRCWSQIPTERPSFKEIFELLSQDFSYLDEDVDEDEVRIYIEDLKDKTDKESKPKNKSDGKKEIKKEIVIPPRKIIDEINIKFYDRYEYRSGFYHHDIRYSKAQIDGKDYYVSHFIKDKEDSFNIQSSLNHFAVLSLVGFSNYDQLSVIIPYTPNSSLSDLLKNVKKGKLPENYETIKAINILGIAAGMAYIHQHDIIHRNLNKDAIILDEDFYPKIHGFDHSTYFDYKNDAQINFAFDISGLEPFYTAPEIFAAEPYSNKIDVYSYSMILLQLFNVNIYDEIKIHDKVAFARFVKDNGRPKIPPHKVSNEWVEVIERCWDQNPENRPSFIQLVKGFIDYKDLYFNMKNIDKKTFDEYIKLVIKDLDFDGL